LYLKTIIGFSGGHYYTFINIGDELNPNWYKNDDKIVKRLNTINNLMEDLQDGATVPYILLYEKFADMHSLTDSENIQNKKK
jgi:ubiquitin C-terminal hydrolase